MVDITTRTAVELSEVADLEAGDLVLLQRGAGPLQTAPVQAFVDASSDLVVGVVAAAANAVVGEGGTIEVRETEALYAVAAAQQALPLNFDTWPELAALDTTGMVLGVTAQVAASDTGTHDDEVDGAISVTASIAGVAMTVTVGAGLRPGQVLSGTNVTVGSRILYPQTSGTPGGAGVYPVSVASTAASTAIAAKVPNAGVYSLRAGGLWRWIKDSPEETATEAAERAESAAAGTAALLSQYRTIPAASHPLSRVLVTEIYAQDDEGVPIVLPEDDFGVQEVGRDATAVGAAVGRIRVRYQNAAGTELVREGPYPGSTQVENGVGQLLVPATDSPYVGQVWIGLYALTTALGPAAGKLIGRSLIDFRNGDVWGAYATNYAFSLGQLWESRLQSGTRFAADVDARVETVAVEVVTPLLPSMQGQRKPFIDAHDATGSVFSNALLRGFVKNVWVYGPSRADNVRFSYMELKEDDTCYIDLYDEGLDRAICRWNGAGIMDFGDRPRFVAMTTPPDIYVYSGDWAILELDWSVLTGNIEGPLSNMTRGGIHPDCLYSFDACLWWARNPVFHETIYFGPDRTYTTADAALASITRPAHPHYSILLKGDDQASDYETPCLDLPDFVSLQGPGMNATAGLVNDDPDTLYPTIERNKNSHVWDLRVQSNTGNGTAGSGRYPMHRDPQQFGTYGSDGGGQRWGVMGSMRNVLLVGGEDQDVNLYGGGHNSRMLEVWHNVKGRRLNPTATNAWFSAHDTGPVTSSGGIYAPNTRQLHPATWELHDCSAPAMVGSALQVISNGGSEAINNLVLSNCDFRLVTQTVSVGTDYLWAMSGCHEGAFVQTGGTGEIIPDLGKLRLVRNVTGSTIPTGRAVKLTGADTIALCGVGERPDGWTIESIADGAAGYINTAKRIATQYLDAADAGPGDWGLNAAGQIHYASATKLGRTSGSIVTAW